MSNHEEIVAQFKDITGSTDENASFFLESSNWSLEDAISSFYENQGEIPAGAVDVPPVSQSQPTASIMASGSTADKGQTSAESFKSFDRTAKPRIATLNTMSKDKESDEEEGQAFYAGGSERSGQQVLGSPKRKNFRDELTNIFRMAQENSSLAEMPSTSAEGNWGVGARLGQSGDVPSERVEVKTNHGHSNIETIVLKLWRQGFSLDEGELRAYDNPINKMFLETVMRGEIPEEMRRMGSQVGVDVEDHRHEDFKPPRGKVRTFNGSGHMLGNPTPAMKENTASETSSNECSKSKEFNEQDAINNLKLNTEAPITSVQIRLADGTRLAARFNVSHTINDIREFIRTARPVYANQNFILVTSFPTKELSDESASIEDAKLQNAVLMQRLK